MCIYALGIKMLKNPVSCTFLLFPKKKKNNENQLFYIM